MRSRMRAALVIMLEGSRQIIAGLCFRNQAAGTHRPRCSVVLISLGSGSGPQGVSWTALRY